MLQWRIWVDWLLIRIAQVGSIGLRRTTWRTHSSWITPPATVRRTCTLPRRQSKRRNCTRASQRLGTWSASSLPRWCKRRTRTRSRRSTCHLRKPSNERRRVARLSVVATTQDLFCRLSRGSPATTTNIPSTPRNYTRVLIRPRVSKGQWARGL